VSESRPSPGGKGPPPLPSIIPDPTRKPRKWRLKLRTWLRDARYLMLPALILPVLLIAVVVFVGVPAAISYSITSGLSLGTPEDVAELNPDELRPRPEKVELKTSDAVTLPAWFLPGRRSAMPAVICCPGFAGSKSRTWPRAGFLHEAGCAVLAFDTRCRAGRPRTLGVLEKRDVAAAAEFAAKAGRPVVAWGVSMGAAAAVLAAADGAPIQALILEGCYDSLVQTVRHHANLWARLPSFPLVDLGLWLTRKRIGIDLDEGNVLEKMKSLRSIPVLLVVGEGDRRTPRDISRALFRAAPGPKQIWIVPGAGHGEPYEKARQEYERRVLDFLRGVAREGRGE